MRSNRLVALLVPLTVVLALAMQRPTTVGRAASGLDCAAYLSPDSAPIQSEPVSLTYTVPDSIGAVISVTPPEDSGIEVQGVDDPSKILTLGTLSATAGQWALTFTGDSARACIGMLTVVGVSRGS
jgi:hypothetical protein